MPKGWNDKLSSFRILGSRLSTDSHPISRSPSQARVTAVSLASRRPPPLRPPLQLPLRPLRPLPRALRSTTSPSWARRSPAPCKTPSTTRLRCVAAQASVCVLSCAHRPSTCTASTLATSSTSSAATLTRWCARDRSVQEYTQT